MLTTRRPRSDSTTAAIKAFQAPPVVVPAYITLRDGDMPYWRAVIACRSDWQEHELSSVAVLARAMADADRLDREIDAEGLIVDGKANVKFALSEVLTRRAVALTRFLQIHARATRGEARQTARQPKAPDVSIFGSDLIARPQ